MEFLDKLISLQQYCRQHEWPRLPQWNYWIAIRKPVAVQCVKKIGGRYMLDMVAFQSFIQNASIEE